MSNEIDYLGEGPTDDAMAFKLIEALDGIPGKTRRTPFSGNGKASLDRRLKGLNAGLLHGASPILILRDLNSDATCASTLAARLIAGKHSKMCLRICVRESESWLLADAERYATYCGVRPSKIPQDTDAIARPKEFILTWAAQAKKLSRFLEASRTRGLPEWAALANWNRTFVETKWSPVHAYETRRSRSLCRAVDRLRMLITQSQ